MSKLIDYINNLPLGSYYSQIFGEELPIGKFFCPFHHNVNTPAAKVYGNVIHCFSCNKNYTTYDLLKRYYPQEISRINKEVILPQNPRVVNSNLRLIPIDRTNIDSIILSIKRYEAEINR